MKRIPWVGALAAAAALFAGMTGVATAGQTAGHDVAVSVASTSLGRVLVDGHGRTLYAFGRDTSRKSACAGACAASWPPLIASGKVLARGGARAALLGTIKRADGRRQVTYQHRPLYAFVGDRSKGQTNGEGLDSFGAEWYAIAPAGSKVERTDDSGGAVSQPSGGYGY
jgi:predicted lipoprotein with Yx(FWY)xxD motif